MKVCIFYLHISFFDQIMLIIYNILCGIMITVKQILYKKVINKNF